MNNLILLAMCLIIGLLLKRVKMLPANAHIALNTIILYVALPAVSLLSLPELQWRVELLALCLVSWIGFGVAFVLFPFLGRNFGWDEKVIGCLILTAGLGNTSFVGFPVIEALYGKEALSLAVLVDQPGTFLIVSSLGVWVAAVYSSGQMRKRDLARKVLLFPPFIAFVLGITLGIWGWSADGGVRFLLEKFASLLTPLALIGVGMQLELKEIRDDFKYLMAGLGYKLLMAPLMIYLLYKVAGVSSSIFNISVIESAMAPMITASILAASHGLHSRLASAMVGVGVPLSFLTLSIWYFFL
jgi:predicted permease